MNKITFDDFLKKIKYEKDKLLGEVKLVDVIFINETKTISLYIEFLDIPPIDVLVKFNNDLKAKLVECNLCSKAFINYTYVNNHINQVNLEKFYKYILKILVSKKIHYKSLESFNTSFCDNEVILSIGFGNDEKIVRPLYEMIEKSFNQLGINFVKFSLIITPLIVPVSKLIEEDKKNIPEIVEEVVKVEVKNNKGYKPPKESGKINQSPVPISKIPASESQLIDYSQLHGSEFVIKGVVVTSSITIRGGFKLYEAIVSDESDSITIKTFISEKGHTEEFYKTKAKTNCIVKVYGYCEYDKYAKDIVLKIKDIIGYDNDEIVIKTDDALVKRVELHAHSKLTFTDSILSIEDYLRRAAEYKHKAIALTDKNSVQGFGELLSAYKSLADDYPSVKEILPIFGLEGYLVDEDSFKISLTSESIDLRNTSFVVYDFETTGLSSFHDKIIEIGAVKIVNGEIVDKFQSFVNPQINIPTFIQNLTNITNDDVRFSDPIEVVLPKFNKFIQSSVLVAHNATFDNGFLLQNLKKLNLYTKNFPTIDTMNLAKIRYKHKLKKFGLDDVRKLFNINLEQHHRASDDAMCTALIFNKMLIDLFNDSIYNYNEINNLINKDTIFKDIYPTHFTILSKNRKGLVNMNRLVTDSHTVHLARNPIITKKVLEQNREGLLIGSGCYHGEIFELAFKGEFELMREKVPFYDYLEILPLDCYKHLLHDTIYDLNVIKNAIKEIIKAGRDFNKLVVATGDVHQLDEADEIYRKILYDKALTGGGIHEFYKREDLPKQYYRTTDEMLEQFDFLDEKEAYEIVVTNTNKIMKMIEKYEVFPKKLFAPLDDFMKDFGTNSAKEAVTNITYETAYKIYGNPLPQIIQDRLEKELNSIIGNEYAPIYYISYLLVKHSTDSGYIVGSRGSIGSSLVANFMRITEVNSLPPHYICPKCKFTAFKLAKDLENKYTQNIPSKMSEFLKHSGSGLDLPVLNCPKCNEVLNSDGFDIPFETFLGFDGDKIPDIDLNFSGEYQTKAHDYCRVIFGEENTFRGGTIGTIAIKSAEKYVTDYFKNRDKVIRKCQVKLLSEKLSGVKKQTGQHPGGIVITPRGVDINEITPVQFPADDITSAWKTTHLDYHKFEANLLKLDILGHDDPTMIRFLMNFVWKNPSEFPFYNVEDIPINDKNIIRLFNGVDVLNVDSKILKASVGTNGIPEFGTELVKDMLTEIRPKTIADIVKISGLSHGENVWQGNARSYFLGLNSNYGKIPFNELIGCRDDIMEHLISKGINAKESFGIMERVRKGKGLTHHQEQIMKKNSVEPWFIESCKQIAYLFPKAHAIAYVIMALRIAWFKLYKPLYYYAGFFSKRAEVYDVVALTKGIEGISKRIDELPRNDYSFEGKAKEEMSSVKSNRLLVCLQVALEMVARGYKFLNVHVNYSHATDFVIEGDGLRIPFIAVDSLGEQTANQIILNRGNSLFTSIKDAQTRGKINTKLAERFAAINAFDGLPKDDEEGIFKFL